MINDAKLHDDIIKAWFQHGCSDRRDLYSLSLCRQISSILTIST